MRVQFNFEGLDSEDEIHDINAYIGEHNLKGVQSRVLHEEIKEGNMGLADSLPVIELVLGSSVLSASITAVFGVIKKYIEMRKNRTAKLLQLAESQLEQNRIDLSLGIEGKKSLNLSINTTNPEERKQIFKLLNDFIKTE